MAFKKRLSFNDVPTITLGGVDTNDNPNPTRIEGYYFGSKVTPAKEYGPGLLHFFQTKDGMKGVWGKTMMNSLLGKDIVGQMVRVTFTGMGVKKKGKRPPYLYDVENDESNTTDVSGVNLGASAEDGAQPEADDTVDNDVVDTDEDTEEDTAPPTRATMPKRTAQAPSAEQQAKVAALLAGKRPS